MDDILLDDMIANRAKDENIRMPEELRNKLKINFKQANVDRLRRQRIVKARLTAAVLALVMVTSVWFGFVYAEEGVIFVGEKLGNVIEYRLGKGVEFENNTDTRTIADDKYIELSHIFTLVNEEGKVSSPNNIILAEDGKDVNIIVKHEWLLSPMPPEPVKFNMLLFIDYKQIEFTVGKSTNRVKKHEFYSIGNEENDIQLKIPAESIAGTHKLMITVEYAEDIPRFSSRPWRDSLKLTSSACSNVYDLILGERTEYNVPLEVDEVKKIAPRRREHIMVLDQDFRAIYDEVSFDSEIKTIRTSPGELVPLSLRFFQGGEKGIFIISINGEQVEIENKTYLYFEHTGDFMGRETFIRAPEVKGEYVLINYFVSEPFLAATPDDSLTRPITTYRMKLIVE